MSKKDTLKYTSICSKCRSSSPGWAHSKDRCMFCYHNLEQSECGTIGICHYCELKIPLSINDAFWHGFGEMVMAMDCYFHKNPHLKLINEHYGEPETYLDLMGEDNFVGRLNTVHYIGLGWIENQGRIRKAKEDEYKPKPTKPKPLVVWYPY